MPKQQPKINWRDRDIEELSRTVKNFNAKIYRLRKKNQYTDIPDYAENYLPKPILKKDMENIISNIGTRVDFNRVTNRLQRFSRIGAEEPMRGDRYNKITKWDVQEYQIDQRVLNRKLNEEKQRIGEKEQLSGGKETGSKRSQTGQKWEERFRTDNRDPMKLSRREWDLARKRMDAKLRSFYDTEQMEMYKINYLVALDNFGYPDELIDFVADIPNDVFYETTIVDEDGDIDFIYFETENHNFNDMVNRLWDVWRKASSKI